MIRLGNLHLGAKPVITAIIDEYICSDELCKLKNDGIKLFEIRVDCFNTPLPEITNYVKSIKNTLAMPFIGTVRETERNRSNRIDYFREILPFVDCVDIELGTPISDEIISCCKDQVIMISEHDFNKTPADDELHNIVNRALNQGAQIVKIATMAHNFNDVHRLLKFTENCKTPLVTIAMGSFGAISRVIAPLFGSLFTYGFIKREVAPGQLSVTKLIEEFKLYYPEFNK